MKTLKNQTLLYDADCPLCKAYTSGFIKAGMLDQDGKKPFSHLTADEHCFVDSKRASNEIALIDHNTKTVTYGIDSLLKIIGHSFPVIQKTGTQKTIHFLLQKLYSFISYNRKVIVPAPIPENNAIQCLPDFSRKYRSLYIFFAGLFTALVLSKFSGLIPFLPDANLSREVAVAFGQVLFQSVFISALEPKKQWDYIGNLMTVSLMGSLILVPALIINRFFPLSPLCILSWFGVTVLIMFLEHVRRVNLLHLPKYICVTWIAYRIIALLIILIS